MEVVGRRVESVVVTGPRTVRRHDPGFLERRLTGACLSGAARLGKYLLLSLDGGPDTLVVHLRMSGQLLLQAPGDPLARHTHAVAHLSDGGELRFVDPRTFGELFVVSSPLPSLGADPLAPSWTPEALAALLDGRRTRLKILLMDQRRLAGLGNIYSDEALFAAGLRFDRPAGNLSRAEADRLHGAITATLTEAVEHRGSTLADAGYVDLFGRPGSHQVHHRVYAREGLPCRRCRRLVVRHRLGGRSTFLCERCQT